MELQKDWFQHAITFLPRKDINRVRQCNKEILDWTDTSLVWKEMLKRDFGVTESMDCRKKYIYWYKVFNDFYRQFGYATPLLRKFLNLEEKRETLVPNPNFDDEDEESPEEVTVEISTVAIMFVGHIYNIQMLGPKSPENYFDVKQLETIEEKYPSKKLQTKKHRWQSLMKTAKTSGALYGNFELSDLISGVISVARDELEDHLITDKYLDIFTVIWGGDVKKSRREKLLYIMSQQNKILEELKSSGYDLEGRGCNFLEYLVDLNQF